MASATSRTAQVTVCNELGLHLRAAGTLVQLANQFVSEIVICKGTLEANGKSIMSLLALAASKGTVLTLQIKGDDAEAAMIALCALIERGFAHS